MATFYELLERESLAVQTAIERVARKAGTTDGEWEVFRVAGELIAEAWDETGRHKAECEQLRTAMIDIREFAHSLTIGPAIADGYWQIRAMANKAVSTA